MTGRPVWFGPPARPLFGWFHAPPGPSSRAGVVLCPPIGVEATLSHYSYRKLAEALEAAGFAVLRFDYEGTGDSAGDGTGPKRVDAWLAGVESAVSLVRRSGARRIVLVGKRVGAILAAHSAARDGEIEALVLWDPCLSGRSFLREQAATMVFGLDHRPAGDGPVEIIGYRFDEDTVRDLSALDLTDTGGPLPGRVLVLQRADRAPSQRLVTHLSAVGAQWGESVEQPGLPVPEIVSIDRIATWLAGELEPVAAPVTAPAPPGLAVVARAPDGRGVTEQPLFLGPTVFGILTEPEGGPGAAPSAGAPTAVFVSTGVNYRIGPGRAWVDMARAWAARGLRSVRIDLSGVGDSGLRPGQADQSTGSAHSIDDIVDVARAVSPDDPSNVVLVGICAGAYQVIEGAIALGARLVCGINPVLTFVPLESQTGPVDPRRKAVRPRRRLFRARLVRSSGLGRALKPHVPWRLWWLLDKLRLQPSPAGAFDLLVERGVDTLIVCDDHDAQPFLQRAPWVIRRLRLSPLFRLEVLPEADHLLFTHAARASVIPLVTDHVFAGLSRPRRAMPGRGVLAEPDGA